MKLVKKKLSEVPPASIGDMFERLTVIEGPAFEHIAGANRKKWLCDCLCGSTTWVLDQSLRSGSTRSCGCLMREEASTRSHRHGHSQRKQSKTYRAWRDMLSRCDNPKHKSFHNYGGRGITYDPRWKDFTVFLAEMEEAPPGLTLDRVRVDEDYSKGNCEWADWDQQALHKRTAGTKLITYMGKTQSPKEWSVEPGVNQNSIVSRRRRGWSVHEMFYGRAK